MKKSDNFDELKNLWQRRKAGRLEKKSAQDTAALMAERLKSFERKQLRINLAKTAALVLILVPFTAYLLLYKSPSLFIYTGAGLILLFTAAFMIFYWKKQFRYSSLDFGLTGSELISSVLAKLNYQKKMFRIHFPLFSFSLLIGINIIYLGFFSHYDAVTRLLYHLAGSAAIFIAAPLGLKIRKIKFNKEYQPLIDELEEISADMKG